MLEHPVLTENDESRQYSRRSVVWHARFVQRDGIARVCRTFDVSKGGVGLFSHEPVRQGESVVVALRVPDDQPELRYQILALRAELTFQILVKHEYRIGLRWSDPDEAAEKLADWLAQPADNNKGPVRID